MSEQPQQPNAEETPPWPTGEPDDSEPTPERQMELRAAYDKNMATGRPPYADVRFYSRGELCWIAREHGWNEPRSRRGVSQLGGVTTDLRETDLREFVLGDADLTSANMSGATVARVNLHGADLSFAKLSGSIIGEANLSGANLSFADLSGMRAAKVDLGGSILLMANLSGTFIFETNLRNANLGVSNLSGALIASDLAGTNLTDARMDGTTVLGSTDRPIAVDAQTVLLDVS